MNDSNLPGTAHLYNLSAWTKEVIQLKNVHTCKGQVLADSESRHLKSALRVDWPKLWCQYNSRFDDRTELPKFETKRCTETATKLHLRVFYWGTEGSLKLGKGFSLPQYITDHFRLIPDPVRWEGSDVIRVSGEKLYDPLISNDIYSKPKLTYAEARQLLEQFDNTKPTVPLHETVSITSLDDRPVKLEPQFTGDWVVLNCCYQHTPSPASLSNFEQDDQGWQFANEQGSHVKQFLHLDYNDWLNVFLDGNHRTQHWQRSEDYLNIQFLVRACSLFHESHSRNKKRIESIILRDGTAQAEQVLQIHENLKEDRAAKRTYRYRIASFLRENKSSSVSEIDEVYSPWSTGTFDELNAGKASVSRNPRSVLVKEKRVAVIGCGSAGRAIAAALVGSGVGVTLINRGAGRGERAAALLGLPYLSSTHPLGIIRRKTCGRLIGKYVQDLHAWKSNTQGSLGNRFCEYCEFIPCEERDAETAESTVSDKMVDVNAPDRNSEFEEGCSTFSRWQVVHFCLPVPEERIQ